MLRALRPAPAFAVLGLIWVLGMGWRLYPDFTDTIRVEGHLTTIDDYLRETCGEKLGGEAATCLAETRRKAKQLAREERRRAALLIGAPVLLYALYIPARIVRELMARRRRA